MTSVKAKETDVSSYQKFDYNKNYIFVIANYNFNYRDINIILYEGIETRNSHVALSINSIIDDLYTWQVHLFFGPSTLISV